GGTWQSGAVFNLATGTASWTYGFTPPGDDTFTLTAKATDNATNSGTSSTNTFTYDGTPPNVTLASPADGSVTSDTTPTFSGTAGTASGDDLTDVTVKVYSGATTGGTLLETLHADPDDGTGAYSVHASPALAQGTYTARAQQVDAVGNTGFSTANTFKVDTTAPTSTISFPADGGAYNASSYQAGCSTPSTDDLCGTSTD